MTNLNVVFSLSNTMNYRAILGISLAAIFAVSILGSAYAVGHLTFDGVVIEQRGNNGALSVHIDTGGTIPEDPTSDFGWAVPANNGAGFLVIATHEGVGDDSTGQGPVTSRGQNQPNAYHTHFLTAAGGGPCGGSPHATSATNNEVGRLKIVDDIIWVKNIPKGFIDELTAAGTFSFTLDVRGGDLCIDVVNTFP